MKGKLDPVYVDEDTGEAEIKNIWKHTKIGVIGGCVVTSGEMHRNDNARLLRDGVVVYKTKIASMRHQKDDINSCSAGKECGITLENQNDIRIGDIIQSYHTIQKK